MLKRNGDHFVIMDMNPQSSYGNRYGLNEELDGISGKVQLSGEYTGEDYQKLIKMKLYSLKGIDGLGLYLDKLSGVLGAVHESIFKILSDGGLDESNKTVLTLRARWLVRSPGFRKVFSTKS